MLAIRAKTECGIGLLCISFIYCTLYILYNNDVLASNYLCDL